MRVLVIIFNVVFVIPWQLFKVFLEIYFSKLALSYIKVLNFENRINRKRAFCLIFTLTGIPAMVWISQFIVAIYILVQWIKYEENRDTDGFNHYQSIVDILFEIIIQMQGLFILFFINYMANGLDIT